MIVTLLDLGVGNLHSLEKSLVRALPEARVEVATSADALLGRRAAGHAPELLVLPGVGAFGAAASRIAPMREALRDAIAAGLPCLGICLGMQLLFEGSDEGEGLGIGVLAGRVTKLRTPRAPHMGWSPIEPASAEEWQRAERPLPSAVYYAHSFACRPTSDESIVATTTIEGDRFPAIVRSRNAIGCQFHPEKSSDEGVALLGALVREVLA